MLCQNRAVLKQYEMAKALPSGHKKRLKNAKIKNKVVLEKARFYDCNR